MAHWRCYSDRTGARVDTAYAKHAAHLLHRMTHNHQPTVREAAAIHIQAAQEAHNTCPKWILVTHQRGRQHLELATTPPPRPHTHHPHQAPPQPTQARRGHSQGHPPAPSRNDGQPTTCGGHHHHRVHHAHLNGHHGPVRVPPRPIPQRPRMASKRRILGVPEGLCHNHGPQHGGGQHHHRTKPSANSTHAHAQRRRKCPTMGAPHVTNPPNPAQVGPCRPSYYWPPTPTSTPPAPSYTTPHTHWIIPKHNTTTTDIQPVYYIKHGTPESTDTAETRH